MSTQLKQRVEKSSGVVLPPEPDLTPEEIVARAEAMRPMLVERQAETERRTFYSEDTHEEFRRAGFYRILMPRRYGGYEFGVETFLRVSAAIARGCPSSGWMYCLGTGHHLAVGSLLDERAQADIFSVGDCIIPATIKPQGTAELGDDGGWILNGTYNYCSGAPYGTHFLGHMTQKSADGEPQAPMLFVAPRSEWTRLDDWGEQLGLKGSGSHSIRFENGRIPAHLTLKTTLIDVDVSKGTPGVQLHGNPLYGGGQLSFLFFELAAVAIGMAHGALDAYEELMKTRTTIYPPGIPRTEYADYQGWYGAAAGLIATAEAATMDAARQWLEISARGAFTRECEFRLIRIADEVVKLCWKAVADHLFPTVGSSLVRNGQRVERVWRDLSTLQSHSAFKTFLANVPRELARAHFDVQ